MKTILVPTDFSESASKAVAFVASLAKFYSAKLILFHVFHLPIPTSIYGIPVPDLDQIIKKNKIKLEQLVEEVARHHQVTVESTSSITFEIENFKKLVYRKKVDLVVMSLEGGSPKGELFGHLSTSLLQDNNFPVLVVPENATFKEFKKILFACDSHKITLATDFRLLKKLADGFKARVQVLHVVKGVKELSGSLSQATKEPLVVPNLEAILRGMRHTYRQMENNSILEGIEQGILEYEADLLVMVPHKAAFWDTLFHQSKIRSIALQIEIPLLALPSA